MELAQQTLNQVESLLDHNKLLIKEIKLNQESHLPEGLCRNVQLIRELDSNMKKVIELYASLSSTCVGVATSTTTTAGPSLNVEEVVAAASAIEQRFKRHRSS